MSKYISYCIYTLRPQITFSHFRGGTRRKDFLEGSGPRQEPGAYNWNSRFQRGGQNPFDLQPLYIEQNVPNSN